MGSAEAQASSAVKVLALRRDGVVAAARSWLLGRVQAGTAYSASWGVWTASGEVFASA